LGLNRLVVGHHLENIASQKLIERLEFRPIGIEHQAFMKDGRWIDTKIYELLKRDRHSAA
jgi:RimJ/RimL family protein N-acetyltransferase